MNQRLRILFSTESADPWILDAYKSFFDAFKSNHEVEIFCTTDGSKRDIDILPAYNIIDYSYLTKAGVPELVQRMITHIDPKLVEKAAAACSWSTPETIVRRLLFFKAVVGLIKPDVVIVWNGMSDIRLVVREFLEEVGIPFVYAEKGMLPNSWYIDPSGINARCSLTPDCTEQKTAATNQKDLLEYVNSIVSTGASAWEQPKRHGRSEFLQSLNILPQSKIIFFPGQVEKDSNIVHFSPLKSMVEAVKAIIDAMPAETVLLVKPHPKSSSESQYAVADLAATHPNVVVVKDVNVWDIIEAADVVVSINSTVAFESLLQQKNVVLLGEGVLPKTGLVPQTPVGELKNVLSSYLKSDCAKNANFERSLTLTDFLRQKYYMFKGKTHISPFAHSLLSKYTKQSAVYPFTRNELFISFYRKLPVVLTTCNRPQMLGQVLDGFAAQTAPRKTIQASTIKSENTAVDYFLNAQDEFSRGNFAAAVTRIQQYMSVMDYSKLPQIVNPAKGDKTPDISVVVVTYNRNYDVKKCLESLWNQNNTGCSFEVIVVDNGGSSVDSFKQYITRYIKCPINFNLSEGRNIGAHFANGRILVFLDDDALVGSNYLLSIKMAFDKLDIFGLRGRAYPKSDPDANKGVSIYNLGDSPFPSYCNQEGNSAFRRDIYLEMGGMDPLLFGHEGCDLTYRIIKAYKQPNKVIYWPWTIIYHDFGSLEKAAEKKKLHQLSSDYLKFKHNADIFVNRKEIERCPLPIKQTFVPQAQNHPAPKSPATSAIAAGSIKPKVSIVIACHNSRQFLPQCLDSIKNQTMTEWELLLLDDASTDGTRDIIENYSRMDARIKPSYFNDKQGPYVRRNFAIERAACDFIIIQDSDDIMHPSKCQRLYEEIIKDNQLGVVGSFYRLFLDEFKGLEYTEGVELPLIHEQIMEKYKTHLYICWHASAIIRKSMFDTIGLYDENPYGSDKLWLAKAAEYVQYTSEITFANIPEYLTLKREHASSQQGVLPPIDPRSRRAMFQAYWVDKLAKIREKFQKTPGLDIKAELKNCKCNDYIQRFSCLFEKWESQPLDENMLYKFVSKGIIEFKEARHVTCLITLDGVEKILSTVSERFKNYDLLRGMASFVLDRKVKSIEYLNREIRNHNSPAAKQFIADFFENHSKTDVHRWCTENDSRYDLQIIDLGKAGDRQQAQIPVAEKQPLVSVIMPAYNAAEYIAKAIESALNQTYKNFELIVINDGSTDQTENIILSFNDQRIKYSRQENHGLAATHNTGIRKSAGEFVIKLDVDDMMTPDFIVKHITEFEKHPEADLVYCDDLLIDENDQPIRVINRPEYMDAKLLIRDLFRCGFPVVPFRTCIRKNVFDKIGYFDETLRVAEDYDMMRRFVKHGLRVHHLPAALYLRRIVSDSLSRKFSAEKAKSHFDVVKRYSHTFACEELFPDVNWSKVAPEKRRLQAKCLSAVTCFTIGQSYAETAPVYAKTAFDQACSELDECFRMDPANPHVQQLLRKCEAVRTQCEQAVQKAVY